MTPEARRLDLRADPDADLGEVVRWLEADAPIAYPTETVYGLGGALTEEAVRRVRRLKGREETSPLLVLVPSRASVHDLVWTAAADELASAFWPGALTLVLPDPRRIFPPGVRSPTGAVGVRVSPHPFVTRLLSAFGRPVTSTSLNPAGEPSARSGAEATEALERMHAEDDILLIDGGVLPPSSPSTVVDCTGEVPVVLRTGSVPAARLRCVIPEIHERPTT